MNLFTFQIDAANQIVKRFIEYNKEPLMVTKNKPVPFYQNLSSITGSGKTLILVETVAQIRASLPVEPIVLWLSKGKVVVEQTLLNLSVGKYSHFLGDFDVKPLLEVKPDEIENSSKGLILVATVGKFNQKDKEKGDRRIFRTEMDIDEQSLWDKLSGRWDRNKRKRPLIIVYDEGHNLSNQQTKLLLDLNPDILIAASATTRVPEELSQTLDRLRNDNKWKDEDISTTVKSSDVVEAGLIKQRIQLGGYLTPMELAIDDLLADMETVLNLSKNLELDFSPKAIYVSTTNVVPTAIVEDSTTKTKFEDRQARPIVIWRYLVSKGIDPADIAVYCNLKFGRSNQPPSEFNLFSGGDSDYQNFINGNFKHIIFNLSLQEGWDDPECYFAYVDKDMGSKAQITQVIGRVLRQPNAQHYGDIKLNTAHFYVRTDEKNTFQEVIQEVRQKLSAETPEIELTVYQTTTNKRDKSTTKADKQVSIPAFPIKSKKANQPVEEIMNQILDYRNDETNTVGNGERLTVLQKVGKDSDAIEEWIPVEHSNTVTARWILSKEIQKYYPSAIEICGIEEEKFDAKLEYNSLAALQIRKSAVEIVDVYLQHSEIVQDWTDEYLVPDVAYDKDNFKKFKNAVHSGYSGMNKFEVDFANALDKAGYTWLRNPARGFFEIPLLDKGRTKHFNPDFIVWLDKSKLVALDTKGDHLLKEAAGRKLFQIKKSEPDKNEVMIRLISKGKWVSVDEKRSVEGFTVWKMKNARIEPINVKNIEAAITVSLEND